MEHEDTASRKSSLKCRTTPPAGPNANRLQTRLMLLCAVMAMILLGGCASTSVQGDSDPWKYNPDTGFPAVGGPSWGH
jgi:hypothetical protein